MPAAFEGKSFLLTYPQSNFQNKDVQTFLRSFPSYQYSLVSKESHADGSPHTHCVIHFRSKQRLASTAFDFQGRHPNVKAVGKKKSDWENVINYSKKDGNWLEDGTPRFLPDVWAQVSSASSRSEALELIKKEKPRDFIINRRNIDYSLDQVCNS